MSNDLGEASTEGKLSLSGAPQFAEKIEDQKTAVDAPWKIAAKVSGDHTTHPKLIVCERIHWAK